MLFNSYTFIFLFLPIVFTSYFYLSHLSHRASLIFLVTSSLFFYAWWDPSFVFLLLGSIMVNYYIGRLLSSKRHSQQKQKIIFIIGLVFNLLLIGYYKYAHFILENLNSLLDLRLISNSIILPLAISFFTFQQIAYLIDCNKEKKSEDNFLKYCLFITFFPQLIAGPILHHKEMMHQFNRKKIFQFNRRNCAIGSTLFILGLFKKVIIADNLSEYANPVFNAAKQELVLTFFESWGGALAYSFQLYFDFSGYSDMALGLGRLFNIQLPLNFNSPYQAKNIIDFWRRWHMTLSRFLRDYLYIPLGGNQKGESRRFLNLLLTMLIGGLWHGAGWTFILWGGLHGIYLTVNHLWLKFVNVRSTLYSYFAWGLTFISIVIAWVFFRSESVYHAISLLKSMFLFNGLSLPHAANAWLTSRGIIAYDNVTFDGLFANNLCYWPQGLLWLVIAGVFAFFMPNSYQWINRYYLTREKPKFDKLYWRPHQRFAILVMLAGMIALLNLGQLSQFLYFQF